MNYRMMIKNLSFALRISCFLIYSHSMVAGGLVVIGKSYD